MSPLASARFRSAAIAAAASPDVTSSALTTTFAGISVPGNAAWSRL